MHIALKNPNDMMNEKTIERMIIVANF
jgi:hypothetical protein